MSDRSDKLIPKHGGYRRLRSFQAARLVYDATRIFCRRFIAADRRTQDQMVQAARSGVQNIAEGSAASGTSKKTELKLTNVARASLEELRLDYEDFLRQRVLPLWDKDSPQARAVRSRIANSTELSDIHAAIPEVAANTLLCLIHQASYLLNRQIQRLERDFVQHGGFTERLHAVRHRARQAPDGPSAQPSPACPQCGKPMVQRTALRGPRAGQAFWGCAAYPDCRGTRPG